MHHKKLVSSILKCWIYCGTLCDSPCHMRLIPMRAHGAELKSQRSLADIVKEHKVLELRREDFFAHKEEQEALKKKWGFAYYGLSPMIFEEDESCRMDGE